MYTSGTKCACDDGYPLFIFTALWTFPSHPGCGGTVNLRNHWFRANAWGSLCIARSIRAGWVNLNSRDAFVVPISYLRMYSLFIRLVIYIIFVFCILLNLYIFDTWFEDHIKAENRQSP